MHPKIIFRYSRIYAEMLAKKPSSSIETVAFSHDEIAKYIDTYSTAWASVGEKILNAMEKIMGMKWKEKELVCYIIPGSRAFSDPLTISVYQKDEFIDRLTHELIHRLSIQEPSKLKGFWEWTKNNYGKFNRTVKNHILVHAIHKQIYLTLFDKEHLNADKLRCKKNGDYVAAWKIVEKVDHKEIIKKINAKFR